MVILVQMMEKRVKVIRKLLIIVIGKVTGRSKGGLVVGREVTFFSCASGVVVVELWF